MRSKEKDMKSTADGNPMRMALIVLIFLLAVVQGAWGGEPLELIRSSTDRFLEILKDPQLKQQPEIRDQKLWEIVTERFDFEEMARRSLALHWRKRTSQERKEFVDLFSHLLHKSYVSKLENYTDEKVECLEDVIRGNRALVKTRILSKGTEIHIDYKMMKKPNGWKIYDVIIEGVSLVNNYRNQFHRIVTSKGYEELIKRMRTKWEELIKETEIEAKKKT
jgi:phospholipid transport system substrate-binding protein